MKANELRIGNYVLVNGKIIKVNDIDEIGINSFVDCDFESVDYGGYFDVNKVNNPRHSVYLIEPIQLTEERLLKFGFEKVINKYPIPYGSINFILERVMSVSLFKDKFEVFIEDEIDGCNVDIELKSVHKFQNLLFALTNIELVCQ